MIIIKETVLSIADNSGAYKVRCIGIPGKGAKKTAHVGDIITVTVISAEPFHAKAKVKKGDIFKAVIVTTKSPIRDQNGGMTSFSENSCVLLRRESNYKAITIVGTRILTPISSLLRKHLVFNSIVSIASQVY